MEKTVVWLPGSPGHWMLLTHLACSNSLPCPLGGPVLEHGKGMPQNTDSYTLNKNMNATCKVLVPCFMSWNKKIPEMFHAHKKTYFSKMLCTHLFTSHVSVHLSFAKRIHKPDSCGISRSWFNSMIITQVHLVLGTKKGPFKMCSFVTQHNATDVSSFQGECNWHADCRNVHQSCCQRIEC